MALLAYNLSGAPLTLAAGVGVPVLPASGEPVNVTSELRGLSDEDFALIEAQRAAGLVRLAWTGGVEYSTSALAAGPAGGASSMVVWAPYVEPLPQGAVRTWAEAVAAVSASSAPETVIQILANPNDDDVYIPDGVWNLNNTLIVGTAVGAYEAGDYDLYRAAQDLLYVSTDGLYCYINGCRGVKNVFFRGAGYAPYQYSTTQFTVPDYYETGDVTLESVEGFVVGRMVYCDVGYYLVTAVNATTNVVTLKNIDLDNSSPGTILGVEYEFYPDNAVFVFTGDYEGNAQFIVDNADFRYGNYTWGTLHVYPDSQCFMLAQNGASVRWYAARVDGYMAFETNGPCWLGSAAVFGYGTLDTFEQPGAYFRNYQDVNNWYRYQSTTSYLPSNSGNWSGDPYTIQEALDRLAAACVAAGHTP